MGGRWAVRLAGLEDGQDVASLLVEAGLAVHRDDLLSSVLMEEEEIREKSRKRFVPSLK